MFHLAPIVDSYAVECELVLDEKGNSQLSEEVPTKVLAVDSIAKMAVSVLLTVLTAISGWLLVTVISLGDRMTRAEAHIENHTSMSKQILNHLELISSQQSTILQNQARFETEIKNIKRDYDKEHNK